MEANEEIRKYEETINHLFKLLITVCQERDEARDQLQVLLRNLQPSTHFTPQQVDHHHHHPQQHPTIFLQHKTKPSNIVESIKELDTITSSSKTCPYELSLATLHPSSSNEKLSRTADQSSNLALPEKLVFSRDHDKLVDRSSLVIDKLVLGKPLPQKGNLLRTVTEAGPLLQTLLVAPLPQWQNPPPPSSSTISSCCLATLDDQASAHQNSAIVTSLSLTVPGNYCESSVPFVSGYGPSVNNKPVTCLDNDSDMLHKNILTGKKRKYM